MADRKDGEIFLPNQNKKLAALSDDWADWVGFGREKKS